MKYLHPSRANTFVNSSCWCFVIDQCTSYINSRWRHPVNIFTERSIKKCTVKERNTNIKWKNSSQLANILSKQSLISFFLSWVSFEAFLCRSMNLISTNYSCSRGASNVYGPIFRNVVTESEKAPKQVSLLIVDWWYGVVETTLRNKQPLVHNYNFNGFRDMQGSSFFYVVREAINTTYFNYHLNNSNSLSYVSIKIFICLLRSFMHSSIHT